MDERTWTALRVTLEVALAATALTVPPAVLLARFLARSRGPLRALVQTCAQVPLVLPPTAIGFLLLVLLSRRGPLGFDPGILFTRGAAVLAAAVVAFPLVAQTAMVAFDDVDPRLERMAATLGMRRLAIFARVTLPLAGRGLAAAAVLGFSRALGEFGATVIVAGNIPGETQTLALAIFEDIQLGRDERAFQLVALVLVLAFAGVATVERLRARRPGSGGGEGRAGER